MRYLEIIVIVLLFILAVGFSYFYNGGVVVDAVNSEIVCINSACFDVEVVSEPGERQQGLMFREELEFDSGMLFVFDETGNYPFWMKNTLIPLDIIWISESGRIVFIYEDVQPCPVDEENCLNYNPNTDALYVLEINEGRTSELGISVGDKVKFK